MTILVTGGSGFVGLNLVEALLARGDRVLLCDRTPPPLSAREGLENYGSALSARYGDVLDQAFIASLFAGGDIERVVHCAAVTSGPKREAADPGGIIDVNLKGTAAVLAAARERGVARFIYVGSGAAYGETLYSQPRFSEEAPSVPHTLYSITKFAAERMCLRLQELWQVDVRCVRLGTVIGPWERDTGARDNYGTHTQLAGLAARGETAVMGAREVQRDWIYARDVAGALIAMLDAREPRHRLYNLSSGVVWTQPIAAWCAALARAFPQFRFREPAQGETPNIWYTDKDRGIMDISRLANDLGYRPRYDMTAAYDDFIAWIGRHTDFYRASDATRPGSH